MFLSGICWHCHGMKMIHEKFRKYNFVEGKRTEGREDAKENIKRDDNHVILHVV